MESKLVVLNGTSSKTGQTFNRCEGCQHNNEQEEEAPLPLTGVVFKRITEEDEEDNNEETPLLLNTKY